MKNVATRRGIKTRDNWTPLGLYLKSKRVERGISQKEMAAGIGVSPAYLSALEHGQRGTPSFVLLQRVIGYLGVIWDEADELQRIAALSDPRVIVDTSELSSQATELACRLAEDIHQWDEETITNLLSHLPQAKR